MLKTSKRRILSLVGVLALALVVGGISLFAGTSVANAAEMTAEDLQTITQSTTGPGLLGEGYLTHGGWGHGGIRGVDYQQLLADALGITVEDLQAAYQEARTAAIEGAVEEGLITQEQADEMLVWGGTGRKGLPFFGRRPKGVESGAIDEEALLAEALDITVEKLQAAREEANQAAIAQAVEEGIITQEQADQMLARKNLRSYLDRNALLAEALGMTVEDLEAAYADGKTLTDLMSEQGTDAAAVREKLTAAYEAVLDKAVEDGVITQEQADEMVDRPGFGFGGFAFPGDRGRPPGRGGFEGGEGFQGRGGFKGRGGSQGEKPPCPDTDDDTGGARFRRPMPSTQGDSTL